MKKAILIAIDGEIKVIIGKMIRIINIEMALEQENIEFFDQLFDNYDVLSFNDSSLLNKAGFISSVESCQELEDETEIDSKEETSEIVNDEVETEEEKEESKPKIKSAIVVKKAPIKPVSMADRIKKEVKEGKYLGTNKSSSQFVPQKNTEGQPPQKQLTKKQSVKKPEMKKTEIKKSKNNDWYKSSGETTIIIDDIRTGEKKKYGDFEYDDKVTVFPNRATNFAKFDKEEVKDSSIMRRLIEDGTLTPCSEAEARQLEQEYQEKAEGIIKGKEINDISCEMDESGNPLKSKKFKDVIELGHETEESGAEEFEVN